MSAHPPFDSGTVEAIAKVLGEAGSGPDISRYLKTNHLVDDSGESTKWRRLNAVFTQSQTATHSANQILGFIRSYLVPTRFIRKRDEFEHHRGELNAILIMHGLEYTKEGEFKRIAQAKSLDEAEKRAALIRDRLASRNTHAEVYKYCRAELMQENYFHAVFEACKGLFQRIRNLSGIQEDGAALIDVVFSIWPCIKAKHDIADYYRAGGFKVISRAEAPDEAGGPPFTDLLPPIEIFQRRGARMLDAKLWRKKCFACIWANNSAVEIEYKFGTIKRYRKETFCYGPRSCPFYDMGPPRQVQYFECFPSIDDGWMDDLYTEMRWR